MKFRTFITITESGHIRLKSPKLITVILDGEPVNFENVVGIDPRFEFMNLPPSPGSNLKKFLGESPFSLPLVTPEGKQSGWIVSDPRKSMMFGGGQWSASPSGRYEDIPLNWADKALITDQTGFDLIAKHRQSMATVGASQPFAATSMVG